MHFIFSKHMFILIVDTEGSQSLCELGAVLYDTTNHKIIQTISTLVPQSLTPCMERLDEKNQDSHYAQRCQSSQILDRSLCEQALLTFIYMFCVCDIILAHNAEHDKSVLNHVIKDLDMKPWMCTLYKFRWPNCMWRPKLETICQKLNVPYNNAHVAISDCFLLLSCLLNVSDYEEQIKQFLDPQANIETDDEWDNETTLVTITPVKHVDQSPFNTTFFFFAGEWRRGMMSLEGPPSPILWPSKKFRRDNWPE